MIHLCLTYDYELFFGKSFCSEKEVLIEPTEKLLGMYDKHNIKVTLFADVCSIMRYEELKIGDFSGLAKQQLKDAVNREHDVQLHIHPHWINANFEDGSWNYDKSQYKLGDFISNSEVSIQSIIEKSKKYLTDFIRKVDDSYECNAYRAGGYCVQPDNIIFPILYENGIVIDSSVCPGTSRHDYPFEFDYKNIKRNRHWLFNAESGLNSKTDCKEMGNMIEIPIPTINSFISKVLFKIKKKTIINKSSYKGTFVDTVIPEKNVIIKLVNRVISFNNRAYSLNFDEYDYMSMIRILQNAIINKYDYKNDDVYVAIVGHPKMLDDNVLKNTEKFIDKVRQMYGEYICFDTMRDVKRHIVERI